MAHQPINHGSAAGDGQGETLFSAFQKVNANDAELFGAKTVFVANYAALPVTGEVGKVYVTIDDDAMYRWTGTEYDDLGGIPFVANAAALPAVGEALKIYVAIDTGVMYRWNGSAYQALTFGVGADAKNNTVMAGADGAFALAVSGVDRNFQDTPWTLVSDFSEAWTSNASGVTSLVDGGVVGLKKRQWEITATAAELTYVLPVGKQFVLDTVKTVGILVEADPNILTNIDIYFGGTGFSAAVNRCLRFPVPALTAGGLMFLTCHVSRTAAESPIGVDPWAAGFTGPFTQITERVRIAPGSSVGAKFKLHGIFVGGKSKPKMMVGFDMWATDKSNLYSLVFPQFAAHGWRGYLAPPGGSLDEPIGSGGVSASEVAHTQEMYAAGWDVINHSWTHSTPAQLVTYDAIRADYTTARTRLTALGFGLAAQFGAWPQNSTNAVGKQVIEDMGYKMWRGLSAAYRAPSPYKIPLGHRFESPSWDMSQHTGAETVAAIRAAVREGVSLDLFTHSVYKTGDAPGIDPGDGSKMTGIYAYDIWESTWNMVRNELRAQEMAGAAEMMTPSEWYSKCTGEAVYR